MTVNFVFGHFTLQGSGRVAYIQIVSVALCTKHEDMNGSTTPTTTAKPAAAEDVNTNPRLILIVAVGSSNPAKINAVHDAFRRCLDRKRDQSGTNAAVTLEIEGFSVDSGVDHQPFGDTMTCQGAKNRAQAAYFAYKKKNGHVPHMGVGLEGGVEWVSMGQPQGTTDSANPAERYLFCMAWMAVYGKRQAATVDLLASVHTSTYFGDKKNIYGLAKTASFQLPHDLSKLIVEQGMELGEADDYLFQRLNSKKGSGTVGLLTDGLIDRAAYYEHAIILALGPWLRPDRFRNNAPI